MRVWYGLARTLSQVPGVPVRKLAFVAAIWVVPLLLAPPLFSRDVYSYAAQGEMMSHHISPYHYGPDVLGAGPYVSLVDPLWGTAPAPYGPLFLKVDGTLTSARPTTCCPTWSCCGCCRCSGSALIAFSIPKLARSLGRDPSEAFALAVLNPVTMLHLVGGAHNDALMVGLLVAGITAARRRTARARDRAVLPGRRGQGAGRPRGALHRLGVDGPGVAGARADPPAA